MGHEGHNWLSAAHQPGLLNVTADCLSRHFEDGIEWELNRSMLETIGGFFGVPQIDLFACRINLQTSTYASWKRDSHASYVDAFPLDWSQFTNSYILPPPPFVWLADAFIECDIPGEIANVLMSSWRQPRKYSVMFTSANDVHVVFKRKRIHCS